MHTTAARRYPDLILPDTVALNAVTIWSNGIALDGDLYLPRSVVGTDIKVSAVVMSHGLGGTKDTANRYAALFAEAGMAALTFSQSGCGASEARVVLSSRTSIPELVNSSAVQLRDVVNPLEWVQNFRAALDFLEGEANVDSDRMGAWGTSFGGGVALHAACNDERIKCLATQVPAVAGIRPAIKDHARRRAIEMARGLTSPLPDPSIDRFPFTAGVPNYPEMLQYRPIREIGKLAVPTLLIDAGQEEMFDIRENGGKVAEFLKNSGAVPYHYEIIPAIDHYGIYFEGFERGSTLARDWLIEYL